MLLYCHNSALLRSIPFIFQNYTRESCLRLDDEAVRITVIGGATDFKVGGTKQDSRAERTKKKSVPPLFQMWDTSKQIAVGAIEYIEICCLVVALINIGRPRPNGVGVRLKVGVFEKNEGVGSVRGCVFPSWGSGGLSPEKKSILR